MPPPLADGIACLDAAWPRRHLPPPLHGGEIHVGLVDFSRILQNWQPHELSATELRRAARYQNPHKRQLYLGGRLALRRLLCHYLGVDNAALRFTYGARGKPQVVPPIAMVRATTAQLEFNYSLSQRTGLYAFAWNRAVGVDLEVFPRRIAYAPMAERILSRTEYPHWRAQRAAPNEAMLACWTRKEAYGKAIGVGIRYFMPRVSVFYDLHHYAWQTPVEGLFTAAAAAGLPARLHGLQLALPFAGAAALMYAGARLDAQQLLTWRYD